MISLYKSLRQSNDEICEQLSTRYGMDDVIWNASQRKSCPYNLSLLSIFSLCLFGLLIVISLPLKSQGILSEYNLMACIATTTFFSIIAFYLTDKGISEFKEKLQN